MQHHVIDAHLLYVQMLLAFKDYFGLGLGQAVHSPLNCHGLVPLFSFS